MNLVVNPFLFSGRYWVGPVFNWYPFDPAITAKPNMIAFGQIQMKFYQM